LGARVLIFDEPTSSLSQGEAERLMQLIDQVKANGVGVTCIYVSHRLEEVFRICDHVTVLRDGKLICTVPVSEVDKPTLVARMVGRELDLSSAPVAPPPNAEELLRVSRLHDAEHVEDVSFAVHAGEIIGLAGLVGAGRTEALESLFGLKTGVGGEIVLKGSP